MPKILVNSHKIQPIFKYYPEEFIHISNKYGKDRFDSFKAGIGVEEDNAIRRYWKEIEKILDFIRELDSLCHKYNISKLTFFGHVFHEYIQSDLLSLIILFLTGQKYQLNIVLRHFIEIFMYSLFADLISNFKGTFDYFLYSEEWKPFRDKQRISWEFNKNFPNRSVKQRLERIRLINLSRSKEKKFYKHYFATANQYDIGILFSLPICRDCIEEHKKNIKHINFPRTLQLCGRYTWLWCMYITHIKHKIV
jgi:hypothetical protein